MGQVHDLAASVPRARACPKTYVPEQNEAVHVLTSNSDVLKTHGLNLIEHLVWHVYDVHLII